jgi:hypothetical protein
MNDYEDCCEASGVSVNSDEINHPSHYMVGGIETISIIRAKLLPDEYRGYLKGNVIKYLTRAGKKVDEKKVWINESGMMPVKVTESRRNELKDLKKAQWYLSELIKEE